jgi:hypothetical protein
MEKSDQKIEIEIGKDIGEFITIRGKEVALIILAKQILDAVDLKKQDSENFMWLGSAFYVNESEFEVMVEPIK